jgi:hypothetical protein
MKTTLVDIPADRITDWESFHDIFTEALGFPSFYGRNMDAWIDCMAYADAPQDGMLKQAVSPGDLLTLKIDNAADFARRCPQQFESLIDCTAFVNYQRTEVGKSPVLSLLISGCFP